MAGAMRALIVTEKQEPPVTERDGGSRVIDTLRRTLGAPDVMQFGPSHASSSGAGRSYTYPVTAPDRFQRRLSNAEFIAERVRDVSHRYDLIVFVHVSMQFGFAERPLTGVRVCTLPMFLTPSYRAAGEQIPAAYTALERKTLAASSLIVTPSYLEARQLTQEYGVAPDRVRIVPRGVSALGVDGGSRSLDGPLRLCAVGSIKRQKNTLGLVGLLGRIRQKHPGATLRVVGPVQDIAYEREVMCALRDQGLGHAVEFTGHVAPANLGGALAGMHFHLSASHCETFGRAIFESLAAGLPTLSPRANNAAAEHLDGLPYARFYERPDEALSALDDLVSDHSRLSMRAREIGQIFSEVALGLRLAAELRGAPILAVSDFDGTLFHKADEGRTRRSIDAFMRFPHRVVCSARRLLDLRAAVAQLGASADFLIASSGAVVADGDGTPLWTSAFAEEEVKRLAHQLPADATAVLENGRIVQFAHRSDAALTGDVRVETYQGVHYVGHRTNSKLRATLRLLRHLEWTGRVRAFGDGPADDELLRYFDGVRIGQPCLTTAFRTAEEIAHVD
jgi:glycosyltransferase involved in cell wall biosynthesis